MDYQGKTSKREELYMQDALRLEAVTVSVGFDDLLDYTLSFNHAHFDTLIVVTTHEDYKTQRVANKHGAVCVQTDLFKKNGREFNKGAAINAGFGWFQWYGYRMNLDADIVLPDKFRQTLFNHSHLERDCLYGADRVDVIGQKNIERLRALFTTNPQHHVRLLVDATHDRQLVAPVGARIVSPLDGYTPIGYFQLWHASTHRDHPYSLGTAAHDDLLFSRLYPVAKRRLLPGVVCYHICPEAPQWGQNWEGKRTMPRLKR